MPKARPNASRPAISSGYEGAAWATDAKPRRRSSGDRDPARAEPVDERAGRHRDRERRETGGGEQKGGGRRRQIVGVAQAGKQRHDRTLGRRGDEEQRVEKPGQPRGRACRAPFAAAGCAARRAGAGSPCASMRVRGAAAERSLGRGFGDGNLSSRSRIRCELSFEK